MDNPKWIIMRAFQGPQCALIAPPAQGARLRQPPPILLEIRGVTESSKTDGHFLFLANQE